MPKKGEQKASFRLVFSFSLTGRLLASAYVPPLLGRYADDVVRHWHWPPPFDSPRRDDEKGQSDVLH